MSRPPDPDDDDAPAGPSQDTWAGEAPSATWTEEAPSKSGGRARATGPTDGVTPEAEGRYDKATKILGAGGMGRVVLVRDAHLDREVARKELVKGRADAVARFVREARITARLDHPNIVPIYELGRNADGGLYYTMRRVRGRTLSAALKEARTLEERLALLPHFVDACQAMAWAHTQGVVHRDLKPENVLVGEFGETQVADWGIAKVTGAPDDDRAAPAARPHDSGAAFETRAGAAVGTPAYMSPEQARGDATKLDARTDVWGLGAILFELLTGQPPLSGDLDTVLMRATEGKVDDVEALAPQAPRELVAILRRCLAADPARRYPTAAALAADVVAFQRGAVVSAYAYTPRERALRFVRQNRNVLAATLVFAVAIAAIGAAAWVNVLAERDRAQEAEAVARRQLGHSLARAALERYDAWDDAEALTLAALSLTQAEDPRARGVLVAAGSGWLPRLVWEAEPDLGCFNATFGPQGDFACRGPLTAHWWWGWPDGPRGRSPSPYPDNNAAMLAFSGDGQRLAVGEMQGTRFFARGETGPGEIVEWLWTALPAPGPDFYAYAGDETGAVWLSRVGVGGPARLADLSDVGVALWPAPGGVDAVLRDCSRERWTGGSDVERLPALPCHARSRGEGVWWSGGSWLGSDPIVHKYDAAGAEVASFIGPGGDVSRIDATPSGDRLYVGTADGRHRVYDGEGAPIGSLPAVSERTTMAAWHPDGARIAVAGQGGSPRVFEVPAGLGPNRRGRHQGAAYDVWFEGDAVITSGEDGALRRWSRTDASAVEIVPINTDGVPLGFLARSAEALLLSDDAGRVHRLDPRTLQPIAPANPLCKDEAILGWVQESPDRKKFAFGCHDGRVVVTDGRGELLGATETIVADHPTDGLGWAPDGSLLYTMGRLRDEVVVFDGATLARRATWSTGPCAEGRSLVVLADGTVVIGGMSGLCRFDAQGVAQRVTDTGEVIRLGLDGASGLLAVGGPGGTRLFDTSDWSLRAVVPQRGRQPLRLRFEGDVLAVSAFDGEVWWYDLGWLDRDPREALAEAEARFGVRVVEGEVVQADPR